MDRKKIIAIVNSQIGSSRKEYVLKTLKDASVNYVETIAAGDAVRFARCDAEIIIAVGGDGTVGEVLNGMDVDKQKLLVLPAGTLNTIGKGIGIKSIESGLALINECKCRSVDYLDVTLRNESGDTAQKRVMGFIATGFDGAVVRYASSMKFIFPQLRYVLAGWRGFLSNQPHTVRYTINGENNKTRRFTSIMINNCCADNFSSIKKYSLHDGTIEMKFVKAPFILQVGYVLLCKAGYNRGYLKNIKNIDLSWNKPLSVMADGELYEKITGMSIRVHHKGLQLIC